MKGDVVAYTNFARNPSLKQLIGRISAERKNIRVGKIGCALKSCIRNSAKAGGMPVGEMGKRDFTVYHMSHGHRKRALWTGLMS